MITDAFKVDANGELTTVTIVTADREVAASPELERLERRYADLVTEVARAEHPPVFRASRPGNILRDEVLVMRVGDRRLARQLAAVANKAEAVRLVKLRHQLAAAFAELPPVPGAIAINGRLYGEVDARRVTARDINAALVAAGIVQVEALE